ncbi:MAG: hypothetical protein M3Z30_01400, partial [Gemmatimonadota bacterium]|nr:hypothetical protein [Gemmatimonadota bacterium]
MRSPAPFADRPTVVTSVFTLAVPATRRSNVPRILRVDPEVWMREMESTLSAAFDAQDPDALLAVDDRIWGAWVSKVMYGLLANELGSRNVGMESRLTLPDELEHVRQLALTYRDFFRAFLLSTATQSSVLSIVPFRTQFDKREGDLTVFNTGESVGTLVIQVLGVAAFVSVRDAGYCAALSNSYTAAARSLELNPIQLIEIYCRYIDHLNNRLSAREARVLKTLTGLELQCFGTNVPGPAVQRFLAPLLRDKLGPLGFTPTDISDPPQTWLLDGDDRPRHLPLDATRGKSPHRK